ncbi:MAG: DUF192 domain-containing protein [Rhodospirillaceae bacterium]|nr:DUF192 domain-containing protein [Rhodospirillaceae bacterium]
MKARMKVYVLALGLALAAAPALSQALRPFEPLNPAKAQSLATSPLTIDTLGPGGKTLKFTVELADTPKEQEIGLMHRNTMAEDHGMLFDFHEERRAAFWMRNTFIPLDLLFIRANGDIEAIKENAVPHSETPIGPRQPVQAVLELVGGTAQKMGIKPGDRVHHAVFKNAPRS